MKIEDLKAEITKDCTLDLSDPEIDRLAMAIPQLHNKYAVFLQNERLLLRKYEAEHSVLKLRKWRYYAGKMDQAELQLYKLDPFPYKVLRQDLGMYLEADEDLQRIKDKLAVQTEKIKYIEATLDEIMRRGFLLNTTLKNRMFLAGTQ